MTTYEVKISCGNCSAKRKYKIPRETTLWDAELICPNCGCCPTDENFIVLTKDNRGGKARQVKDEDS